MGGGVGMPGMPGGQSMEEMHRQMLQNPEQMQQMMSSPMVQQMMSNPEVMESIINSNPQMRAMMEANPQVSLTQSLLAFWKTSIRDEVREMANRLSWLHPLLN